MSERVNQRWPDGLLDLMRAIAAARGMSVTAVTVEAVQQKVARDHELRIRLAANESDEPSPKGFSGSIPKGLR